MNAHTFLAELLVAESGFYFLDAKNDKDLQYLRAWDFRNQTREGITLILATIFENESTYMQAKGRVLRDSDMGSIYTLPRKMWID